MRKSTLFISAVLTTFILAVLFSVVSASRNNQDSVTQTEPTALAEVLPTDAPLPDPTATAVFLTPEQAAELAGQVLGRTDLLSVETALFNNESVYLVKFMNGDQVFLSPSGSILSVVLAPPPVVVISGGSSNQGNNDRPRFTGGGGGGGGDDGGGDD